jgi:hypothetical protein
MKSMINSSLSFRAVVLGATVVAAAPCNIVRVMSYGVTPQLRAPLQKRGRLCVNHTYHPYTRARGFPKLCVSADHRPPLATLGEPGEFNDLFSGRDNAN